jgi:hypothetical protein
MVMRYSSQSAVRGGTWKGVFFLLSLTILSVLSINVFGIHASFLFLPLMAVFLWPRVGNPIGSIIFILLFGLLLDVLSSGPRGLWALIFLTVFTIFGPLRRLKHQTFRSAYKMWFLVLGVALLMAYLLGWFALRHQPDLLPMIYQAAVAVISFPFVYGLRHLARSLFSDPDRNI